MEKSHTVLGGTALYRLRVNSWSVVENVIHSKGWSHNGDVVISCTALFINKVCSFWLLAFCKILLCEYDPFIVIEHCSVNQIYSNGLKFIFLGHSSFRVIHWETTITKVHSQTLMAMKSGCKMYTHKCYVTLEWPLMLHFKHRMCCPLFVQCALRK